MKLLRETIRRLILENDDSMIDYFNNQIDDYKLNEDNLDPSYWNQLDQLIEDVFPDVKPPTLKVWEAAHPLNGEVFVSYVTQEEALTAHLRMGDIVPADNEGKPTKSPEILDWNSEGYAYIFKQEIS